VVWIVATACMISSVTDVWPIFRCGVDDTSLIINNYLYPRYDCSRQADRRPLYSLLPQRISTFAGCNPLPLDGSAQWSLIAQRFAGAPSTHFRHHQFPDTILTAISFYRSETTPATVVPRGMLCRTAARPTMICDTPTTSSSMLRLNEVEPATGSPSPDARNHDL
jgi:hypothetical protein